MMCFRISNYLYTKPKYRKMVNSKLNNKNKSSHSASTLLFWHFFFLSIKPYYNLIIGQIIVAVIWSIDFVIRPYLTKIIIDLIPEASASCNFKTITLPATLYFFVTFVSFITFRFYEYFSLNLIPNLIKSIGITLMSELMGKPHIFFQNQFSGNLANKINDIASGISRVLNIFIDNLLSVTIALLISIYAVYSISLELALLLALWIVIFLGVSFKCSKKASEHSKHTAQNRSEVVGGIVDILSNISSVRLFVTKQYEIKNLDNLYQKFVRSYQNKDLFFIKLHSIQEVSIIIYQVLSFLWLLKGIKLKTITLGDFTMVMMINLSIINVLYSLSRSIRDLSESFGNISQGLQIIFFKNKKEGMFIKLLNQSREGNELKISNGNITLTNVTFSYPLSSKELFAKLSLTIPAYQKVGIVGYSGSGKTTLINLILGIFEINSGQILIDGNDIRYISKESLRKNIAVIPQDIALFNRTLIENIRYGTDASDEEVIEASKKAKSHHFISLLPNGYNTLVGERGIKLSGGERQRIAIARAILKNAPILLLDEATNQLDSITECEIKESLNALMQNKTTIIIAHRLSTLLHLERILVFDKGSIVQDDTHKSLINQKGLYKTLWNNQLHGILASIVS